MAGDGYHLTAARDGVLFELQPGSLGMWAWTTAGDDDALLALDVDSSGRIDSGAELFGDGSPQVASASPNGFMALAYYDLPSQGGNGDGTIDAQDVIWPRLRLWRDADHDAFSASYELTSLDAAGVRSLSLTAVSSTEVDEHGNEFRFRSTLDAESPIGTAVYDVWLTQAPIPETPAEPDDPGTSDYTLWTCWAWVYAITWSLPHVACDNWAVQNDPLATANGQLTRLVARFSSSKTKTTAKSRSQDILARALNPGGDENVCLWAAFPTPDLYYAPPYDRQGDLVDPRVKCFSKIIREGGGGDGGGCFAHSNNWPTGPSIPTVQR